MQGTFYSIKELAERVEIDWETLLNWKYRYLFHLPAYHDGNQLKYPAETMAIFQFIKEAKEFGLQDDVIQLWVDKQADQSPLENLDLFSSLQGLVQDLQREVSALHSQWQQKHLQYQETLLTLMENITSDELKALQRKCPHLLSLEQDGLVKAPRKRFTWNFFERVNYN